MALQSGTRLGPYEIQAVLGAGGMGEVYRALDTALNRPVAIKVLPDAFAEDAERVARFTREAQTLAALNHSNIATIYGLQDVGGGHLGLVMELVEGDDLSALIARGPMAIADALPIARQIADALEVAHELGVVHRDLKPANVKVRADGTVKVLDFGLAKALTPDASAASANNMNSPTLTAAAFAGGYGAPGTQLGVILGTAAYMAPEQAKGKAVDRRADIWAFGVVLYEMLSGRRAFDGEDVSMTLAAVLMRDPDWSALPNDIPPALNALVRRCLERDPKLRLRDIGEARVLLTNPDATLSFAPAQIPAGAASADRRRSTIVLAAGGIILFIVAAAIGAAAIRWLQPRPPDPIEARLSVPTANTGSAQLVTFALSPDGKTLAYIAADPSSTINSIWIRPLADLQPRILRGTDGVLSLCWAPDSQRIAFFGSSAINIVDIKGGVPSELIGSPAAQGVTWAADGTIVVARGGSGAKTWLATTNAHGDAFHDIVQADAASGQTSLNWPSFLPDGRHFLYVALNNDVAKTAAYIGSINGEPPVFLMNTQTAPIFAAPDTLLFLRDSSLMAQTFDPVRLKLSGEPVRLVDDVMSRPTGRAAVAVSNTGVLAYRLGTSPDIMADLTWIDRSGQELGTVGEPGRYNQLRLSPDEKRVAVAAADPRTALFNVWVLDLGNRIMTQTTFGGTSNDPVWFPDSQTLMVEGMQKGKRDFYRQQVGAHGMTLAYESAVDPKWIDDLSADGRYLLFHLPRPGKLFSLPTTGSPELRTLTETPANIDSAHFSPDGKWVAYGLNESGTYEVWVAAFPEFDRRQRVSAHGGGQPFWRFDGTELYYLSMDGKMMSVSITGAKTPSPEFGAPKFMFQSPIPQPLMTIDQYAVSKDGKRFLFLKPRTDQLNTTAPITVVVNWQSGLKK